MASLGHLPSKESFVANKESKTNFIRMDSEVLEIVHIGVSSCFPGWGQHVAHVGLLSVTNDDNDTALERASIAAQADPKQKHRH